MTSTRKEFSFRDIARLSRCSSAHPILFSMPSVKPPLSLTCSFLGPCALGAEDADALPADLDETFGLSSTTVATGRGGTTSSGEDTLLGFAPVNSDGEESALTLWSRMSFTAACTENSESRSAASAIVWLQSVSLITAFISSDGFSTPALRLTDAGSSSLSDSDSGSAQDVIKYCVSM
eukprot:CAMPEP_0185792904 /NCGR_PEP_ID=MMETSP1174-20130828/159184_1 /TAXON_ID=35687 /ORGANISM="Dictyocha speculum, Strain CCMP1381" /LENGTH=177 /DNA_ID=CAMNT_0028488003 /DNA_START=968 /DNA_END=1501 /DNA_ORIENTATION=-